MGHTGKLKGSSFSFRTPCTRGATRNRWAQAPQSALRNPRGFTYIALLAAIVIIGISMGAAGKYWQNISLRQKEEELLFRGDQYRQAIERYYLARMQLPQNLEDLLRDPATLTKRYLRKKYLDPITGEQFSEIRDQTTRIIGVCSSSEKEPLKQSNFPDQYQDFEGKKKYNDWKFQYTPPASINPGLRQRARPLRTSGG